MKYQFSTIFIVFVVLCITNFVYCTPVRGQEASLLSNLDPAKANVNGDTVVNGLDYAQCLFVYGKPDAVCDIVKDGEVNSLDITYILGSYGPVTGSTQSTSPTIGAQSQSQPQDASLEELLKEVEKYDRQLQELGIQ